MLSQDHSGYDSERGGGSATPLQQIGQAVGRARHLTRREHAIFRLLGHGYDNRSIAHELDLSEYTVKRHITNILTKLELSSRLQAGLAALMASGPAWNNNNLWHLSGMDAIGIASYACEAEHSKLDKAGKEVTWMAIEERKISVARNSLPG